VDKTPLVVILLGLSSELLDMLSALRSVSMSKLQTLLVMVLMALAMELMGLKLLMVLPKMLPLPFVVEMDGKGERAAETDRSRGSTCSPSEAMMRFL